MFDFLLQVLEKSREFALWILHELLWIIVLQDLSLVEVKDLVTLDDSVESMGNGHGSGVLELLSDHLLDLLLGNNINIGCGFIENHNLVSSEDGADNANELLLANAEVASLFLDLEVEALSIIFLLILIFLLLLVLLFVFLLATSLIILLLLFRSLVISLLILLFVTLFLIVILLLILLVFVFVLFVSHLESLHLVGLDAFLFFELLLGLSFE